MDNTEKYRQQLISDIQNSDNEYLLQDFAESIQQLKETPPPAMYTINEMRQRIDEYESNPNPVFLTETEFRKMMSDSFPRLQEVWKS